MYKNEPRFLCSVEKQNTRKACFKVWSRKTRVHVAEYVKLLVLKVKGIRLLLKFFPQTRSATDHKMMNHKIKNVLQWFIETCQVIFKVIAFVWALALT